MTTTPAPAGRPPAQPFCELAAEWDHEYVDGACRECGTPEHDG